MEWKYVMLCHMNTPESSAREGPYMSNLMFRMMCYFYPGWSPIRYAVRPPVVRSTANPWAPDFKNDRGNSHEGFAQTRLQQKHLIASAAQAPN